MCIFFLIDADQDGVENFVTSVSRTPVANTVTAIYHMSAFAIPTGEVCSVREVSLSMFSLLCIYSSCTSENRYSVAYSYDLDRALL